MATNSIAIIDSGGANIASLMFALQRLGCTATLSSDAAVIEAADRVILPGVGAARNAMDRLRDKGLLDVIRRLTQPVLGICLGMQLLADASEEEDVDCLGVIPGTAGKLEAADKFPVPNMGWCPITTLANHEVLENLGTGSYFYFLHSYALPVSEHTVAHACHSLPFAAVVAHRNFVATQFHPERSSSDGAKLLKKFVGIR
jgi:glutamine amidotransferase